MGILVGVGDYGIDGIKQQAVLAANESTTARDQVLLLAQTISSGKDQGPWNVSSNSPSLSASSSAYPENAFFTATVGGTAPFAGMNFTVGATINVGDVLAKVGTQWYLRPKSDLALQKVLSLEQYVQTGGVTQNLTAPLAVLRYTGSSSSGVPSTVTQSQVNSTTIAINGYTDSTAFQHCVYFDTTLPANQSLVAVTLTATVNALVGTGTSGPAIGVGFGTLSNGTALIWRSNGFIQRINQYSATNLQDLGSSFRYVVGDTLKIELSKNDQGNLLIRVQKNGGTWSAYIPSADSFSGNVLIANRGSMNYNAQIALSLPLQSANQSYTDTKISQAVVPINSRLSATETGQSEDRQLINLLNPISQAVSIVQIRPSSSYAYNTNGSGPYTLHENWLKGKNSKAINRVGVFVFKNTTTNGVFSNPGRLVVIHRPLNGTDIVVLNRVISVSELQAKQSAAYSGNAADYEMKFNLERTVNLAAGDDLYTWLFVQDAFTHFTSSVNALQSDGEWNDAGGCYRASTTPNPAPSTPPSTIRTRPASNSQYTPIHFYYEGGLPELQRIKNIEDIAVKNTITGSLDNTFQLIVGGVSVNARLITSNGYDYKGTPDKLMIICHGNGQNINAIPSANAMTFFKANKISVAIINTQDEQGAGPFTTNATGWGNQVVLQRTIALYEYLMSNYNFRRAVILAGQSMGGLAVGHLAYTKPFPIHFCLSIGGVPSLKTMFVNGLSTGRRPSIRAAYGMASSGSDDNNVDTFIQGYDWFSKGMIEVGGVKYKHLDPHWYIFVGTGNGTESTFVNDFGGTAKFTELRDAINRTGGLCTYAEFPEYFHADAPLYEKAIAAGVFLKELGIAIPA